MSARLVRQFGRDGAGDRPSWAQDVRISEGHRVFWAEFGGVECDGGGMARIGLIQEGHGPVRIWLRRGAGSGQRAALERARDGVPEDEIRLSWVGVGELIKALQHAVKVTGLER